MLQKTIKHLLLTNIHCIYGDGRLKAAAAEDLIETVHSMGYRLQEPICLSVDF